MIENLLIFLLIQFFFSLTFRDSYISKLLSLTVIGFIAYFLAHFTNFSTSFMISSSMVGAFTAYRLLKDPGTLDLKGEAVFLGFFLYFLFLRSLVPDLNGAEKFMDTAILNSVLNSDYFPPPDPYFGGERLDVYYYFGQVIAAVIAKFTAMPPEYAYNVAMAFFSAVSFSLLYGLLRERGTEWSGTVLLTAGPLYSAAELINILSKGKLPEYLFYWNSTRIIPDSTFGKVITEFPYFSFIHADLHAHTIAIPLKILFIAILYKFYREDGYSFGIPILNFVLFATNSWDAPAFFLISSAILIWKGRKYLPHVAISAILILMFRLEMKASAPVFLTWEFSPPYQFLMFWGIFLVLAYHRYFDDIRANPYPVLLALPSFIVPAFLFIPPTFYAVRRKDFDDILLAAASAFILVCEFTAIDSRMNTYFKFYLLAWVLLIPALSDSLKKLYERRKEIAVILIALMLVYPVFATPARHYKAEYTLDGLKFMKDTYPGDYSAVKWLYGKNTVIVEGVEGSYTYSGRIASFSANQAVIAWPNHEVHWRDNGNEIAKRMADVKAIYTSKCEVAREIAKKYDVRYIIYGDYERKLYGKSDLSCMPVVFESYGTTIYAVEE